jgi:gas vesicle protein
MEATEYLKKQFAFNLIAYLVKNEVVPVNDRVSVGIEQAREFFGGIVRTAESIANNKASYVMINDFRQILEFDSHYFGAKTISKQKSQLEKVIKEFKDHIECLDEIESNAKRFYSEGNHYKKRKLLNTCEKMRGFFSRKVDGWYENLKR